MNSLRLKKGDTVKVITGQHKGKTGKIVSVSPKSNSVKVEGIGLAKRHSKPNMLQPHGGISEIHTSIDASKVAIVHPTKKGATSKISYSVDKDGTKKRIYKATNKEIA